MSRHGLVGALLVVIVVVAACGEDGSRAGHATSSSSMGAASSGPEGTSVVPDTTTAPGPTSDPDGSTPPVGDDEAAVRAAVDCYWRTIVEANDPPDPDHPGFDQCFTGPALERSRGNVLERQSRGERIEEPDGGVNVITRTIRFTGEGTATVTDCLLDDSVRRRVSDGSVLDDSVLTITVDLVVVRHTDTWRVSSNQTRSSSPGRLPCEG